MATPKVFPEPDHEPIGLSDEGFPRSRHWLALLIVVVLVTAAAVTAAVSLR